MQEKIDLIGITLLSSFFILLLYAGFLSYQSIDWDVLKRMEQQPFNLPPPQLTTTPISTPSASATATPTIK